MTANLQYLDWTTPWGLLVLPLPLLLAWLSRRRRSKLAAWADPHLMPWAVAARGEAKGLHWRRPLDWLAWMLLAVAAAGPRLPLEESIDNHIAPTRHVMSVMVALDMSASMSATDIAPDRFTRARLELSDFISRLNGERVGIVLYAGEAGMLLPPTDDSDLFNRALGQASPDLLEEQGSNPAAALELAEQALRSENASSRAVLLVTDAETDSLSGPVGESARKSAEKLKAAGIPLYVLVVASRTGAPIPLAEGGYTEQDGAQVISQPSVESYAELAGLTGGRLAEVSDGDGDWQHLYDNGIATLPGDVPKPDQVRVWRSMHTVPLLVSLMLFMFAWLPRATPSAALLVLLMLPAGHDVFAAETDQKAWQAYRAGKFNEALKNYTELGGHAGQMGAGASAWKLKDYPAAARHFGNALMLAGNETERTDALYNLGNAHFALARWQTAAEAYRAVLKVRPSDQHALTNLAVTERQLARQRESEPIKTDLRGRRGSIAEGEVNVDWDKDLAMPESEASKQATLIEESAEVSGARLDGDAEDGSSVSIDARTLQSGLRKLERLEERPRSLLKGLLKQDRTSDTQSMELPPW